MELNVKQYKELTLDELHDIYRYRVSVFVVEQNCPYQEIDGNDKVSWHLWLEDKGEMVAYLRVLPAGTTFEDVSIGRMICTRRRQGLATQLLREGIKLAVEKFHAERITIEAQVYARGLYEKVGFVQTSDEFLEDGIPHIKMTLEII
ncbi:MAG: GNAT family N-acetyltransferase [Bacteroidales bacterium]|nr:GNAT family N-acetyltransferase [Bacteroidales bacterium]